MITQDSIEKIYTPLSEIKSELKRRRSDKELMNKVSCFFGSNAFFPIDDKPKAVLSRSIATPNNEVTYFLELTSALELDPLILEYPDKFVAKNTDKYHLCKLYFMRDAGGRKPLIIDTRKIIDFNNNEGKCFKDIKTIWGESIIDFHHRLFVSKHQNYEQNIVEFSKWFNRTRCISEYYYQHYLSLFICNAVLFENFILEDKEEICFIREKLIPSFNEVERVFGLKPLIFSLLPSRYTTSTRWFSYPESIKSLIADEDKSQEKKVNYPKLVIKTINGKLGVYASADIMKGSVIKLLQGEVVTFEECIRRISAGKVRQIDTLQIDLEEELDLDDYSNAFQHSCNPNAAVRKDNELVAIKDIKKGEEVTYDYSATVGPNVPNSIWEMQCNCRSVNCRKKIQNVLSIPPSQLRKYLYSGALQNYIRRELLKIKRNNGKLPEYKPVNIV